MAWARYSKGIPWIPVGSAHIGPNIPGAVIITNTTCDATKEAVIFYGQLWWTDGASHTIDTTGSSSIGWRAGTVTFLDPASSFSVGIADLDQTAGPPARPINVASITTNDVAAVFTGGGGGIPSASWQESVPTTGSKTIAHLAEVAISLQMTNRSSSDSVIVSNVTGSLQTHFPALTTVSSAGTYTRGTNTAPNVVVRASDGTYGFFVGGICVSSVGAAAAVTSASSPNEYGNVFRFPSAVEVLGGYGLFTPGTAIATGSNYELTLYATPFGTPSALRTMTGDANVLNVGSTSTFTRLFSSPVTLDANTDYVFAVKPTSNSIDLSWWSFNVAAHQNCDMFGTDCYAVNRAGGGGAFAAQNSSKDRMFLGLLINAFPHQARPSVQLGI